MPMPNQHAARLVDPSKFKEGSFRTKEIVKGITIIMGKLAGGDGSMVTQTYRFDKDTFTAAEEKKWLKDNDVKPISFEAAEETKMDLKGDDMDKSKLEALQSSLNQIVDVFGENVKANRRNNADDQQRLQTIHDMSNEMGAQCGAAKVAHRFSSADMKMLQGVHDTAVNMGAVCKTAAKSESLQDKIEAVRNAF